jgi:hypothetical protein
MLIYIFVVCANSFPCNSVPINLRLFGFYTCKCKFISEIGDTACYNVQIVIIGHEAKIDSRKT